MVGLWGMMRHDGDGKRRTPLDMPRFLVLLATVFLVAADAPQRGFEDVTARAGVAVPHHNRRFENPYAKIMAGYTALGAAAAVADFDGDGFDDVFTTDSSATGKNRLYRNNHNLTFTDVAESAGVAAGNDENNATADALWFDFNNDGRDDLYVACDVGTDHFFRNKGDGTFEDLTEKAIGIDTKKGMNVDWGDFDNDGLLDIYVTNITDDYMREGNFLWKNNGNLTFTDISRETGTDDTGWGWAGKFFDYDNDGWLDLYVVNGWVSGGKETYVPEIFEMVTRPNVDFADARNWPPIGSKSLSGYQKKRLFHNENGHIFKDEAARHGLDSTKDGRGVAVADFDNDGRLDLFVTNADDEPYLYHNVLPAVEHWMGVLLHGTS